MEVMIGEVVGKLLESERFNESFTIHKIKLSTGEIIYYPEFKITRPTKSKSKRLVG